MTAGAAATGAHAEPSAAGAHVRVFGLDLLRALAVSMVLVAHASYLLEPAFTAPRTFDVAAVMGVELFFVLSGFLVGGIVIDTVARDGRWLGNFWLRRWMRTLPNYFLFLVLNIFLFRMAYRRFPAFASYFVFAQGLAWPHPQFFNEAWSLAVEEVFYLLAPLVAIALLPLARSRGRVLAMLVAGVVVLGAVRVGWVVARHPEWDMGVRKVALVRLDCIVYGVIAAYACRRWVVATATRWGVAGVGVVLTAWATWLFAVGSVKGNPIVGALFFSLVPAGFAAFLPLAAVLTDRDFPAPFVRAARPMALWSYSLYLTNLPVLRVIDAARVPASTPVGAIALFSWDVVVAVAWAAANYTWLERPIMDMRDAAAARLGLTGDVPEPVVTPLRPASAVTPPRPAPSVVAPAPTPLTGRQRRAESRRQTRRKSH